MEAPAAPEPQERGATALYEELRRANFIPNDIKESWNLFEHRKRRYLDNLRSLEADQDLTPEAKQRKAAALQESEAPKIEKHAKELRAALLKSAENAERASIPTILSHGLEASDATELVAAQLEAAKLIRIIERMENQKGPFRPNDADILAEKYEQALKQGGLQGATTIRACLQVAEERGLGTGWIPRKDYHREFLDTARRREYAASAIPSSTSAVPAMPRSLQPPRTLSRRPERRRATGNVIVPHIDREQVVKAENQSGTLGERRAAQKDAAAKKKKPWK